MQKKFVLKKTTEVVTAKEENETLVYTSSDFDEKDISIIFKDKEIAEQMGMPTETIGDSVIIEFSAKEVQSKLSINEKEPADDGGGE